jgi:glycosyltransferase involved in cell wall biosynthesis
MIDVILPVLNEREAIPWVLERMPTGFNPIVVDNGSTDNSAAIASRLNAEVVFEPHRGFGAACWRGLLAASTDVVCFMDCDGSLHPADLERASIPVADGDVDLVLGARIAERGAWAPHARLANRFLAFEVRRRTGVDLRDIGPLRATLREPLIELGIQDRRSGWPLEMVLRAIKRGWRIHEIEVDYAMRRGASKVTGTLLGTLQAVADMGRVLR